MRAKSTPWVAPWAVAVSAMFLSGPNLAASRVFYDDFESGSSSAWRQDDFRNRCQIVTSSVDKKAGPYAGARMASCNSNGTLEWNDPAAYETLRLPSIASSNELFYRIRLRVDANHDRTSGSSAKILRIFTTSPAYNDIIAGVTGSSGLNNGLNAGGKQFSSYWGGNAGDNTAESSGWHEVEYYFNKSNGTIKVWHDGVLVRNHSGADFGGAWWTDFYLLSNWSDPHDSANHVYFDNVEVFTEAGSGTSGSMQDGSISASVSDEIRPNPPTDVRSQ